MNYSNYKADNFIKDELFQNWVLRPDEKNKLFWENWLNDHPQQASEIQEAIEALRSINFDPPVLEDAKVEALWSKIADRIKPELPARRLYPQLYRAAAVFIGVLSVLIGFYNYQLSKDPVVNIASDFGEIKKVMLPDQSVVILNGNSTLSYKKHDFNTGNRAVELVGEAYFSVQHTPKHQKFLVKLNKSLIVEVLGTKFTVTSRPDKKQVVLNKGSVRFNTNVEQMLLKPGDVAELIETTNRLDKRHIGNPEIYAAFQENKIVFKNTTLLEVARILKDNYGYKVSFSKSALASKRFTGSSPANQIDILLKAIEKSFNLIVIKKGKNIMIQQSSI